MKKLFFILAITTISLASCGKRYTCPTYTMGEDTIKKEVAVDDETEEVEVKEVKK